VARVSWLTIGTVLSAFGLAIPIGREVWLGMFAPLVVTSVTWVLFEQAFNSDPRRLTSVMIAAFAGKLVFFGMYVGLAIGVLGVQRAPFIASFAGYFIVLQLIEAFWLKRLFVNVTPRRGA
jgi:hypothetical protein